MHRRPQPCQRFQQAGLARAGRAGHCDTLAGQNEIVADGECRRGGGGAHRLLRLALERRENLEAGEALRNARLTQRRSGKGGHRLDRHGGCEHGEGYRRGRCGGKGKHDGGGERPVACQQSGNGTLAPKQRGARRVEPRRGRRKGSRDAIADAIGNDLGTRSRIVDESAAQVAKRGGGLQGGGARPAVRQEPENARQEREQNREREGAPPPGKQSEPHAQRCREDACGPGRASHDQILQRLDVADQPGAGVAVGEIGGGPAVLSCELAEQEGAKLGHRRERGAVREQALAVARAGAHDGEPADRGARDEVVEGQRRRASGRPGNGRGGQEPAGQRQQQDRRESGQDGTDQ